jgi:hypothetical protein
LGRGFTVTFKNPKPGDVIVWTHYFTPGARWRESLERIGTVHAGAPTGNSLSNAWWVFPDEPLPGEVLASGVLAVGRAAGRHWYYTGGPQKGEVYGSSFWRHQPAALTHAAADWAAARKADHEEAAA